VPAKQRGSVLRLADGWAYRLASDEHGRRRQVGGFQSKGEARAACDRHVTRVLDPLAHVSRDATLTELVDDYLDHHQADPVTIAKLRRQLKSAIATFGDRRLSELHPRDLGSWRARLSEGSRHDLFRALRQVLEQAVRWTWLAENPARAVKNPRPRRREVVPFESWEEIEAVVAELDPRFAAISDLRRRHRAQARGMDRARTARRRPARGSRLRSPRLLAGTLEALREVESPAKARPAASESPGRPGHPSPGVLTRRCSFRPREAATSKARSGEGIIGHPGSSRPESSIAASMTYGTRSPASRSRQA
jgi:hypothetical protein